MGQEMRRNSTNGRNHSHDIDQLDREPAGKLSSCLLTLCYGDFGCAVGRAIRQIENGAVVVNHAEADKIESLPLLATSTIIMASWRPMPAMVELLDRISHTIGCTSVYLTVIDGVLITGPIVSPGHRCCGRCFYMRQLETRNPEIERQRRSYYDANPTEGPKGYLMSMARFAAAQALSLLRLASPEQATETVLETDLFTKQVRTSMPVGFSNCKYCQPRSSSQAELFSLANAISQLRVSVIDASISESENNK
jgi:bacteriocin biosynthesis cyclodehydratase domain-containing protein